MSDDYKGQVDAVAVGVGNDHGNGHPFSKPFVNVYSGKFVTISAWAGPGEGDVVAWVRFTREQFAEIAEMAAIAETPCPN
jgi:hypothetical protein